jgi:hypothetical protein
MSTTGHDYTDTIQQRSSYTQPPDGWEEVVGEVIGQTIGPLQQRIKALELELAATRGALDILRGKGIPGTFNIKGTFDSRTTYNYLDVVAHNGASWVAKRDNPGPCPGDDWQLLARQGQRGATGERGPAGPAGMPKFGGTGFNKCGMELVTSTGSIQLIKNVSVDPENFTLRFTASDDSTLSISLMPLFEAYDASR